MRRVYVGRLSHHVRERDVERFFRSEGKIREVLMKDGFAFVEFDHSEDAEAAIRHLNGRDINGDRVHVEFAKGPPRGREGGRGGGGGGGGGGFGGRGPARNGPSSRSSFRNDRGRDRGDNHSGGRSGGGGISYAEKYGPPRNTDYRVIVENLSSRVSWQDLKDLMRQAGEVTFADAHKRERNMGIVDFASGKDMKHAVETLNDTEFHGRRIKVYEDKGRRSGGHRGGRSRSRSRGRYSSSRSRSREHAAASNSRSRSRSPVTRDRDGASRSASGSSSPARRKIQRSRSRSRSRSRDSAKLEKRQSRSRSRSRDSVKIEKRQSRSRSHSLGENT